MLFHQDTLGGLGLAFLFAIFAAVLGVAILLPSAPIEPMVGVVKAFGVRETDLGSYGIMVIRSGDALYDVRMPPRADCRVGDGIEFGRARHWWGYTAGVNGFQKRVCFRQPLSQQ